MVARIPFVAALVVSGILLAALEPLLPAEGETVPLLSDAQKTVMNRPTLEARIKVMEADCRSATGSK